MGFRLFRVGALSVLQGVSSEGTCPRFQEHEAASFAQLPQTGFASSHLTWGLSETGEGTHASFAACLTT